MELICWAKSEIAVASATTTIMYLVTTIPTTVRRRPSGAAEAWPNEDNAKTQLNGSVLAILSLDRRTRAQKLWSSARHRTAAAPA